MNQKMQYDTEILYCGGIVEGDRLHPEIPAIYSSTAYVVEDTRDYDRKNIEQQGFFYNRTRNPNRENLAEAISFLEKGEQTLICSSGMAAIATTLFSIVKPGDHILVSKAIYGETIELMENMLVKFGVEVTYTDFTEIESIENNLKKNTVLLYTEIIANPLISIVDIEKIAKIAKENQILLIVDNTFSTPYIIQPLSYGADIVIHSLTKFINGHSDATGGSITASKNIIQKMMSAYLLMGGCLDAASAWLILRSIRTFNMRMRRQISNAQKIAEALEKDIHVRQVNYPGLLRHPQHQLAEKMFVHGYGPMLSFLVEDDREKVDAFIHKLQIIEYLGTLGGYRTSIAHPASAFRSEFSQEKLREMGMTEGLIRISVGAENVEDIIEDLIEALKIFN